MVCIDRTGDGLEELYNIEGIKNGASWDISLDSIGEDTGVEFSITSGGQVQYTSTNLTSGGTITFRAKVTTN